MLSQVTYRKVTAWCNGTPHHGFDTNSPVPAINSDTRTLKPGEVFLALKGNSFDGNAFVEEATKRGAAAVIAQGKPKGNVPYLEVSDSLQSLIAIAREMRALFHGPVVGITGSAGKSSSKEMVATLLGPNTVASPASFNNLLGVSKTICLLQDDTQNLVLEMGMNAFGEIAELCRSFGPEIGAITNIGDAHMGKLGGREGIYRAKKELFDFLASSQRARGVALNTDDPLVLKAFDEAFTGQTISTITYSTHAQSQADVTVLKSQFDPKTAFLTVEVRVEGQPLSCTIPIFGTHHVQNFAASVALARLNHVTLNDIQSRAKNLRPASHRGEVIALPEGRTLIDESYNSNPTALLSSLESLMRVDSGRRLVIVIGEMRELGDFTNEEHVRVGKKLAEWLIRRGRPVVVLGVGPATEKLVAHLTSPLVATRCKMDVERATPTLLGLLQPQDVVFLKGSRGVKLDRLIPHLASGEIP
ncbi:MAG: UDP-N-acetylmuramoyl-tripeptide--D-alanyl-D-alanine ligase [Deltaproteobacteria bacterium]|nr:UDP-N-acetylmuramoyl-tripeptide--D-alanyl-D-alanine ligase [Deltaproteobacteria bacterium]